MKRLQWQQTDLVSISSHDPKDLVREIAKCLHQTEIWEMTQATEVEDDLEVSIQSDIISGSGRCAISLRFRSDDSVVTISLTSPQGHSTGEFNLCDPRNIRSFYLVFSSESVGIFLRGESSSWWGALLGAIISPTDRDSAERDGRLYGIAVSSEGGIQEDFWCSRERFLGGEELPGVLVFDPTSPGTLTPVSRLQCDLPDREKGVRTLITLSGKRTHIPIAYCGREKPRCVFGTLRQMSMTSRGQARDLLIDNSGDIVGILFSPSGIFDADTLSFDM